jgi:hypothetical protein
MMLADLPLIPEGAALLGELPAHGGWIHGKPGERSLQCQPLRLISGPPGSGGDAWVIRFSKWIAGRHTGTEEAQPFEEAYEANFVFLFVGSDRAILFDTGPLPWPPFKATLEALVGGAAKAAALDLIVAHTHSHGDHIQGDSLWSTASVELSPCIIRFLGELADSD